MIQPTALSAPADRRTRPARRTGLPRLAHALTLALAAALAGCGATSDASTSTASFESGITAAARSVVPDLDAWQACRASAAAGARVDADKALGQSAGVSGTPTFLVNGTRVVGSQPFPVFKSAVDAALAAAQGSGLPQATFYEQSFPSVPVSGSPVRGPADAWVTLVEFSDFECPYCASVQATIDQLRLAYPADVRVVFKHYPLSFHAHARAAAIAAECAGEQGRFWEMHDAIFQGRAGIF